MRTLKLFAALLFALCITTSAEARKYSTAAHPDCNILFPCAGVEPSARGQRIVKAMGGFGIARPVYERRAERRAVRSIVRAEGVASGPTQVVSHPSGCPSRLFCGCGAAVRVFGIPIRSLWLAAAWFKFPRAAPAPGMVAVRHGHVFVLEAPLSGNTWQVYDANSGHGLTRIHARSLSGYTIVNPRA